jgi:hypothetical protein
MSSGTNNNQYGLGAGGSGTGDSDRIQVQPGDVIQVNEHYVDKGFVGSLMMVEEVKAFGVLASLRIPESREKHGTIYLRLVHEDYEIIGKSKLVPADLQPGNPDVS